MKIEGKPNLIEGKPDILKKIICIRHGEKEKNPDENIVNSETQTSIYESSAEYLAASNVDSDRFISLTEDGGRHALSRKFNFDLDGFNTKILYSGRARTGQTASSIAADYTKEGYPFSRLDVRKKGNNGLGIDSRIDFNIGKTESDNALMEAYKNGKLVDWIIKESDSFSREKGEYEEFHDSYSKLAANIASLLLEHVDVKNDDKEALVIGSHQGLFESFLSKVIEKTEGMEKRDEFIKSLNGVGFDFAEGFEIDIIDSNKDNNLSIKFNRDETEKTPKFEFEKTIGFELLKEIINEDKV